MPQNVHLEKTQLYRTDWYILHIQQQVVAHVDDKAEYLGVMISENLHCNNSHTKSNATSLWHHQDKH